MVGRGDSEAGAVKSLCVPFKRLALVVLVSTLAACGSATEARDPEIGDVVWSPGALIAQIEKATSATLLVVTGLDGDRYNIPLVDGSDLLSTRVENPLKIWSFYLLKEGAEFDVRRSARPLSIGAAVRVEFGDAGNGPPSLPVTAPLLAVGEVYSENAECEPSRLPAGMLPDANKASVGSVPSLRIWRRIESGFDVLSCTRAAGTRDSHFVLACTGVTKKPFGTVGYSLVTADKDECTAIEDIFFDLDAKVSMIVTSSRANADA